MFFTSFSCNIWLLLQKSRVIVERSYNCLCSYLVGPQGPLTLTTSLQGTIAIVDLISVYKTMIVWHITMTIFANIWVSFHFSHSIGFIWPQVMDTNRTQVPGEQSNKFSVQKTVVNFVHLYYLLACWSVNTNFLREVYNVFSSICCHSFHGFIWILQEHNFEYPNKISKVSGSMSESDLQIWLSREPALMRHHDTK